MRYHTNFGNTMIPLHKDISYLEDYICLQKMRYGKRLTFHCDIEENLLQVLIPKLMLQPLIENAIKHNIHYIDQLTLILDIKQKLVDKVIEVFDNSKGQEDKYLNKLKPTTSIYTETYVKDINRKCYKA